MRAPQLSLWRAGGNFGYYFYYVRYRLLVLKRVIYMLHNIDHLLITKFDLNQDLSLDYINLKVPACLIIDNVSCSRIEK